MKRKNSETINTIKDLNLFLTKINEVIEVTDYLMNRYSFDGKPICDFYTYTIEDLMYIKSEMLELKNTINEENELSTGRLACCWKLFYENVISPNMLTEKIFALDDFYQNGSLDSNIAEKNQIIEKITANLDKRITAMNFKKQGNYYINEQNVFTAVHIEVDYCFVTVEIYKANTDLLFDKKTFERILNATKYDVLCDVIMDYIVEEYNLINNIQVETNIEDDYNLWKNKKIDDEYKYIFFETINFYKRYYTWSKFCVAYIAVGARVNKRKQLLDIKIYDKETHENRNLFLENLKSRGLRDLPRIYAERDKRNCTSIIDKIAYRKLIRLRLGSKRYFLKVFKDDEAIIRSIYSVAKKFYGTD